MPRRRLRLALAAATGLVLLPAPSAVATMRPEPRPPLRVMLTNDDGFSAAGLQALRTAFCAMGADVTVVAPAADQSGSGTGQRGATGLDGTFAATTTTAPCGRRTGVTYAVAGTPAFAVNFGLQKVFTDRPPDLVVSGINPGENIGRLLIASGTVGAALTAASEDVPAIAVNLELDRSTAPTFAGSLVAFPDAARYVAGLVRRLDRTRRPAQPLLGADQVLNVTYPAVPGPDGRHDDGRVRDPKVTVVGKRRIATFAVTEEPPGSGKYKTTTVLCGLKAPCEPETRRRADTTAIDRDHISITPLMSDWSAPLPIQLQLARRVGAGL